VTFGIFKDVQLVEDIDIVNLPRGNDYDRGNNPMQIQEGVELGRSLIWAVKERFLSPRRRFNDYFNAADETMSYGLKIAACLLTGAPMIYLIMYRCRVI